LFSKGDYHEKNAIYCLFVLFVVILPISCKTDDTKKTVPKKNQKGLLKNTGFQFRLENITPKPGAKSVKIISSGYSIVLSDGVVFDNHDLVDAYVKKDEIFGRLSLWLIFSEEGKIKLEKVTGESLGKRLAILVDGKVWIAPRIKDKITGGRAVVSGRSVQKHLKELAKKLRDNK